MLIRERAHYKSETPLRLYVVAKSLDTVASPQSKFAYFSNCELTAQKHQSWCDRAVSENASFFPPFIQAFVFFAFTASSLALVLRGMRDVRDTRSSATAWPPLFMEFTCPVLKQNDRSNLCVCQQLFFPFSLSFCHCVCVFKSAFVQ